MVGLRKAPNQPQTPSFLTLRVEYYHFLKNRLNSANTGLYLSSMLTDGIPMEESYIASETPVLDMSTDANRVASGSLSVDSVAWNNVA